MKQKIHSVDQFFLEGCGRCEKGATADCKVHLWPDILQRLRELLIQSGLEETLKWSMPTYTHQGKNVAILAAFKDYASINFMQGSLIEDKAGLFEKIGEKTVGARRMAFTDLEQVARNETNIRAALVQAKRLVESGATVDKTEREDEPVPEELIQQFEQSSELAEAWQALTPGRQRGYLLHFNQAKQSKTRLTRIEKYRAAILAGKGMHDR